MSLTVSDSNLFFPFYFICIYWDHYVYFLNAVIKFREQIDFVVLRFSWCFSFCNCRIYFTMLCENIYFQKVLIYKAYLIIAVFPVWYFRYRLFRNIFSSFRVVFPDFPGTETFPEDPSFSGFSELFIEVFSMFWILFFGSSSGRSYIFVIWSIIWHFIDSNLI